MKNIEEFQKNMQNSLPKDLFTVQPKLKNQKIKI